MSRIMTKIKEFITDWKDTEFLVVAIIGVISIVYNGWAVQDANKWRKNEFTVQVLKENAANMDVYRKEILSNHGQLAGGSLDVDRIPETIAKHLDASYEEYKAKRRQGKCAEGNAYECRDLINRIKLRDGLVGLLNRFEYIAVAYEKNLIDKEVFKENSKGVFLTVFNGAIEYIKVSNKEELLYWAPFVRVSCEFNGERSLEGGASNKNAKECEYLLNLGKT
uniref:Uncharacterized protein n=1 Tax=Candidatus Kentrum sp. LFY TaxID=2126342 RepID=A0A450UB45_9GAMM|nr:MAG: hypothetical protein BECKLFY1418B_GA0070995_10156 [Candidatus Kentron sp. LFY]